MNNISANADNDRRGVKTLLNTRDFYQAIFYQAFASLDRVEGRCTLIILWKTTINKKELAEHTYVLHFNHEGIKEQRIRRISRRVHMYWQDHQDTDYVQLTYLEAASLIRDAYCQNIRFKTAPIELHQHDFHLLGQNTSGVDRRVLFNKLSSRKYGPRAFVNIYLSALRRMDISLLYDMLSPQRQSFLGDRADYILNHKEEYDDYDCLQSGIISIGRAGKKIILSAYAVFSTQEEEMIKINLHVVLIKDNEQYYIDDFKVSNQVALNDEHPDNPLNYPVFCSVYCLSNREAVEDWLESEQNFFLTGEINDCSCYKELKEHINSWHDFNIADRISGEFILTPDKLIIFAKKPFDLARTEKSAAQYIDSHLRSHAKYYLPVRELYRAVFSNDVRGLEQSMLKYRADSALADFYENQFISGLRLSRHDLRVRLGSNSYYGFYQKSGNNKSQVEALVEYYISGKWIKINVFGGKAETEIGVLKTNLKINRIIYDYEWESSCDEFGVSSVSEQRKWEIYSSLWQLSKENNVLRDIGLVPALRDVTEKMGAVAKGIR